VECCEDVTKLSLCTVRYARTAFRVSDTMVTLWCNHVCHLSYKVPCLAAQGQRWLSRMLGYDRYRQYLARGCFVALCKTPKPSVILVIGRGIYDRIAPPGLAEQSPRCAHHTKTSSVCPNQTKHPPSVGTHRPSLLEEDQLSRLAREVRLWWLVRRTQGAKTGRSRPLSGQPGQQNPRRSGPAPPDSCRNLLVWPNWARHANDLILSLAR
jgi:hypothetical protein